MMYYTYYTLLTIISSLVVDLITIFINKKENYFNLKQKIWQKFNMQKVSGLVLGKMVPEKWHPVKWSPENWSPENVHKKLFSVTRMLGNFNDFFIFIN